MKETIEKEARKFAQLCLLKSNHPYDFQSCEDGFIAGATKYTEELSKLNPNRIDEERMMSIYRGTGVTLRHAIHQYNSTISEGKQELPSVEELLAEIYDLKWNRLNPDECKQLAQHIIDNYSLHSKKSEWWMKLKPNDTVIWGDVKFNFRYFALALFGDNDITYVSPNVCHPYTEPSIRERLIAKGVTNEEIDELVKEVGGG